MFAIKKLLQTVKVIAKSDNKGLLLVSTVEQVFDDILQEKEGNLLARLLGQKPEVRPSLRTLKFKEKKLTMLKSLLEKLIEKFKAFWKKNKAAEEAGVKVIIFDYDDTLFPTTYAIRHCFEDISVLNPEEAKLFKHIDKAILSVLNMALSRTENVYIVSNAELLWIKDSAEMFLPKVHKLLFHTENITVISARDEYQDNSSCHLEWKTKAFDRIHSKYEEEDVKLFSIGDGLEEIYASDYVCVKFAVQTLKCILPQKPCMNQLLDGLLALKAHVSKF